MFRLWNSAAFGGVVGIGRSGSGGRNGNGVVLVEEKGKGDGRFGRGRLGRRDRGLLC